MGAITTFLDFFILQLGLFCFSKIDVLQPLGNVTADEVKQNLGYIGIMRKNLEKISKALECQ